MTVIAQDPSIRSGGKILTSRLKIPAESLKPGPQGARVQVIDYDTRTGTFYKPCTDDLYEDKFKSVTDPQILLNTPEFHAQNVYAIVMATLARFERALGRYVSWQFGRNSHQITIAPHGFMDSNAFYSRENHALVFGYFKGKKSRDWVYTCLSHDIVAHEATHAILDGIRSHYDWPSSPDQAGFHEGFADVISLLSVLQCREVIDYSLKSSTSQSGDMIDSSHLQYNSLRSSILFSLAEEMGGEINSFRDRPLRNSLLLEIDNYQNDPSFELPHRRGEILVAAVIRAFLRVWVERLQPIIGINSGLANKDRVVEEATKSATHLQNIAIRGLDYLPTTNVTYSDYLSALITADVELCKDDSKYNYREKLINTFAELDIHPSSDQAGQPGQWSGPDTPVRHGFSHFQPMRSSPEAIFRFAWENRQSFGIHDDASIQINSVQPVTRIGPDGFVLDEIVAECVQTLNIRAGELARLGLRKPADMPSSQAVRLHGGNVFIFDEFGQLKYNIGTGIVSKSQNERLKFLWKHKAFDRAGQDNGAFARMHATKRQSVSSRSWKK